MALLDTILSIAIIIGFMIIAYSKVSKKSIPEIFEELKTLFQERKERTKESLGEIPRRLRGF